MRLLRRLRALFRKATLDREMSEEMRLHLDEQTAANLAAGMNTDEARYAALRQFGGVEQIKEQARDLRGLPWLEEIVSDFRYGARQLRKAPGFATVAILTLALGIGATTAIFSVLNAIVLRPLDYPEPDQLVSLHETYGPNASPGLVTRAAYRLWSDQSVSFASLAAFHTDSVAVGETGEKETLFAQHVTANYFGTLRIPPVAGRDFVAAEEISSEPDVVILSDSYRAWKFSLETVPVGQILRINDRRYTIIGVLPPNRELDQYSIYLPMTTRASDRDSLAPRDMVQVVGRLKPGLSLAATEAETAALAKAYLAHFPILKNRGAILRPLLDDVLTYAYMVPDVRPLLHLLFGAVVFLLVIACVNVANLLLARATSRRKEIAVRAALGASRGRIIRQLLCESLLLSAIGGLLGILAAHWSLQFLKTFASALPRATQISLDGRVLAFSLLCSGFTGLVFGLYPALRAAKVDLLSAMKSSGSVSGDPATRRMSGALIVAEVALATLLLSGAGLLVHSLLRLQRVELGFRPEGVLANRLNLIATKSGMPAQQVVLGNQLLERVTALPQIRSAALTSGMPIFGAYSAAVKIAGRPADPDPQAQVPGALFACVSPQYFETLGIPMQHGRVFSESDTEGRPLVAIVSEAFVRRYFPHENPLGQRITLLEGTKVETWREIVGVVGDVRQQGPTTNAMGMQTGYIYVPFAQHPKVTGLMLAVRTDTTDDPTVPAAVRSAIQSVDRDVAPKLMYKLSQGVAASIAKFRMSSSLFAFFSGFGVLLAAMGIYGVITYQVNERTAEIGMRMALGAQAGDIARLVLSHGTKLIVLGLALGLGLASLLAHLLQALLFEVSPHDALTYAAIAAIIAAVTLLACWLPARRAAKVDPIVALRCE